MKLNERLPCRRREGKRGFYIRFMEIAPLPTAWERLRPLRAPRGLASATLLILPRMRAMNGFESVLAEQLIQLVSGIRRGLHQDRSAKKRIKRHPPAAGRAG